MSAAFVERLNAWAESLVSAGAAHFVQTLLLAGALASIDAVFGRRMGAYWRSALWLIFFIKLALPPQFALPSSPVYWLRPPENAAQRRGGPMPTAMPSAAVHQDWNSPASNASSAGPPDSPGSDRVVHPGWQLLVVLGWVAGFASAATLAIVRSRRAAAVLRESTGASPSLWTALTQAVAQVGLRRSVRLRVTNGGVGPLVAGIWRPTIYLPSSLMADLTPEQLHAVLVHELLHVKRGDLWVAAMQSVARIVFFHHPAVWYVNAHLSRIREEATDRAVLWHRNVDARAYCLALVAAAEVGVRNAPFSRFALGVVETKSQLRKRIQMNLRHPRSRRAHLGTGGLLSIAALGLVLVPMAPGESVDTRAAAPARFTAVDPAGVTAQIDATSAKIFADFNRRDRDAYMAAFTPDAMMLPPGTPLMASHAGIADSYLRSPPGLHYERMRWTDRNVYRIGRWIVETGLVDFQFRLTSDAPVMSDPRQSLTIWEEAVDGTLRVKVLSWNPLPKAPEFSRPTEPRAFACKTAGAPFSSSGDFAAVLKAEDTFHRAFEEQHLQKAADYYAEQAILMNPEFGPVRGHAAIARFFGGVAPGRLPTHIEREAVHVEGNENHVLVVNLFRWTFIPAGSDVPVAVTGKGIHLWQRDEDGTWKILFDLPNPSQPSTG